MQTTDKLDVEPQAKRVGTDGYVVVMVPEHPNSWSRGWAYEHRVVASKKIGRPIRDDEHVHHKNGDKSDNRPENLEVLAASEHRRRHQWEEGGETRDPGEPNPLIECACGCGETRRKYDGRHRPRKFIAGHGKAHSPTLDRIEEIVREKHPIHRQRIADELWHELHLDNLDEKFGIEVIDIESDGVTVL